MSNPLEPNLFAALIPLIFAFVLFICVPAFVIYVGVKVLSALKPFSNAGSFGPFDLATKVRGLKSQGRYEQAVLLVRGETGLVEEEARSFVDRA
ncbi:hypothetical protein GCM10023194_22330 [Planotetraspora phitsanulokensis]|uniref:Uncharacterized protein n=1 Tax=Planotetraspora phitsanulokensis TaxID=575192 RepID=A0A8J3U4X4_9ACTN|nr:hypothetical protein [Planotetraspora phitsanulokensis]GII38290.1 hypothetical protein Pph01_32930 [Planotetraspora phitsanulokensis]